MSPRTIIATFLIAITLLACQPAERSVSSDITIISIHDFRDYLTDEKFSDLATEIEYIPLETHPNGLIGRSFWVHSFENDFYIQSGNEILVFDASGRYLRKISRQGRGPGEYSGIRRMAIDPYERLIWVISEDREVYRYSLEGEFVGKFNTFNDTVANEKWTMGFLENQVIFGGAQTGNFTAMRYNRNGEYIEPLCKQIYWSSLTGKAFNQVDEHLIYQSKRWDTLFLIDQDNFKPEYVFDFGQDRLTEKDHLSLRDGQGRADNVWHRYYSFGGLTLSGKYMFGAGSVLNDSKIEAMGSYRDLGYSASAHWLFVNLKSNNIKVIPYYLFNDQINSYLPASINVIGNEHFCAYCLPTFLHESKEKTIDAHGSAYFEENYPILADLCRQISIEDNPVIVTFKLNF